MTASHPFAGSKKIGALTIGQTPRPDLVQPLVDALPQDCMVIQAGALDGLQANAIPSQAKGTYLLTTRLRDGSLVKVEEAYLAAKLQEALVRLESQGVVATILLCAGTFEALHGTRPLFKPFVLAYKTVQLMGIRSIGLIAPIPEQEAPIRQRWRAAGFDALVWNGDLSMQDERFQRQLTQHVNTGRLECIVLDYVGHPAQQVETLKGSTSLPVIDMGQLAISVCAGSV